MIIDSRYKVVEELLVGLWATLYKVKDIRTNKIYSLRLFHTLDAKSLYEKFSAENMHHITKIQHPNLLHVLDFGNFGEHIYYISENFEGKTLIDFKFKSSNLEFLYDIVVQICFALNALHSQKIIHQDLKPRNVIYKIKNNKPEVKVTGYGFTKIDIAKNQQKVSGTLPYIAPEIYLGKGAVPQSDFYSLGVILYKITTGTLPYTIEQISDFMVGRQINLFPKFPRELNEEIPSGLEKLILKLLEKNPEDRFLNIENIISYINQIQFKKYPFSRKQSIVNNMKFSDYIVREDYSHQLLDYIPIISEDNGKLITLIAGRGAGKNNVLSLFRYHLLTDEYYIFNYECSSHQKDPFFALIKEFYSSVENNEKLASDLSMISDKLKKYIFGSEEMAAMMDESDEELILDFETAANFVFHLSEDKPLIFMIRYAELITDEVIDFVNFLSKEMINKRILIILSINDPSRLGDLKYPVQMKIEALDFEQTKNYVERLLKQTPPDDFLQKLCERAFGNPFFIERILIDLTDRRLIWKKNKFKFDYDLDKYKLPEKLIEILKEKRSHLSKPNYLLFQKLSAVYTPLSKNLARFILDISNKELFFLMKDGLNNEILKEKDEYFYFAFQEIQQWFQTECSQKERKTISKKVIKYFADKNITQIPIMQGIIKQAELAENIRKIRKFRLMLIKLYADKGEQEKAFDEICIILELDFSDKIKISEKEIREDLALIIQKSDWTTADKIPLKLRDNILKMPDISEKHLLLGMFFYELEKFKISQSRLKRAYKIALTGNQKIMALLKLGNTYYSEGKIDELEKSVSELENYELTDYFEIQFKGLKSLFLFSTGKVTEAINLIEDYLPEIKSINDPNFFIKLGELHNYLAVFYHKQKQLNEADKNFQITRRIWEKINYKQKLGKIYNNIGDVALVKGDTKTALEYFQKALEISEQVNSKSSIIHSLLNHGETYIKLGQFDLSEKYLKKALNRTLKIENKHFLNSIINNLAIAKSRIHNFNYYFSFIKKNVPELIEGKIEQVNPLIKTYFYFLFNIGDFDKIENLTTQYKDIFLEAKEYEFYYQMIGNLHLKREEYDKAVEIIEQAFKYTQQTQSVYAQAINYIRFTECYIGFGDYEKALEMSQKAQILCEKNNFVYWQKVLQIRQIRVQLLDEKINLRKLIRELLEILGFVHNQNMFLLEIEVYEILIQIYANLKAEKRAGFYFRKYKEKLKKSVIGLSENEKEIYLNKSFFYLDDYLKLDTIKIVPRLDEGVENWQEEIYDILKLKEINRIKFFIDKKIQKLFSPFFSAIVLTDEINNKSKPFFAVNINEKKLYSARYLENMDKCIETNRILQRKIGYAHVVFVPLRIKAAKVGCLIIADKGELDFQKAEIEILKILHFHLTSILLRIKEFDTLNKKMELMTKLINITQKFFSILDIEKLEQEMVIFALDFVGASRGFLIKKDKFENYVFKVALDDSKHILDKFTFISKGVLSEIQKNKQPIFLQNAKNEIDFDEYLDFGAEFLSVYCAPIMVENEVHGFLYLDNFNAPKNRMEIKPEFMKLLLTQISVAIKNANQYEVLRKKNYEINALNSLKNDFMNIVSHEFKTPLVSLKGYVNRLKKSTIAKTEMETIQKIDNSLERLNMIEENIINFNKYKVVSKISKSPVNLKEFLESIAEEAKSISKDRHMFVKLELEKDLPTALLNWEAFRLMIFNLVLNSIRFTKDFGTIVIGARRSAFAQEEIDDKESLIFYIQDNGIGIPEHELENVFLKFYELTNIYSHSSGYTEFRSSGLGLGLSTAKLIVELHDGKIWINSKENEGTTVFVAIPMK